MAKSSMLDTKAAEEKMQVDEQERAKRRLSLKDEAGPAAKAKTGGRPDEAQASTEHKDEKNKGGKGKGRDDKEESESDKKQKEKKESVHKKKRDCDFRSGQKRMLILMIKQILRSAQHNRDMSGILLEVMVIHESEDALKMAKLQTVAYNTALKDKTKTGEEMGPPHLLAFAGFLKGLLDKGETTMGKQLFSSLTDFKQEFDNMDIYSRSRVVRLFKIDKMYQQDQRRVSMCIFGDIAKDIVEVTQLCTATLKIGRAPATFMERELQEFLEAMDS